MGCLCVPPGAGMCLPRPHRVCSFAYEHRQVRAFVLAVTIDRDLCCYWYPPPTCVAIGIHHRRILGCACSRQPCCGSGCGVWRIAAACTDGKLATLRKAGAVWGCAVLSNLLAVQLRCNAWLCFACCFVTFTLCGMRYMMLQVV